MALKPSARIDPDSKRHRRGRRSPEAIRAHGSQPSPMQLLASAVRSRRRALRLTQAQLGRLAGCGTAFLYDLESGKPTLRLDKLLDVLTILGLQLVVAPGQGRLTLTEALR